MGFSRAHCIRLCTDEAAEMRPLCTSPLSTMSNVVESMDGQRGPGPAGVEEEERSCRAVVKGEDVDVRSTAEEQQEEEAHERGQQTGVSQSVSLSVRPRGRWLVVVQRLTTTTINQQEGGEAPTRQACGCGDLPEVLDGPV